MTTLQKSRTSAAQAALSCETTASLVSLVVSPAMPRSQSARGSGRAAAWLATAPVSVARPPWSLIAWSGLGLAATVCSWVESWARAAEAASSDGGAPSTSAIAPLIGLKWSETAWPLVSGAGSAGGGDELGAGGRELAELAELAEVLRDAAGGGGLGARVRRAGEVGLGDDGGQQALQRRVGAGEVLEVVVGGGEVGQRRQRDVVEEAVPLGDEVVVVELEHVLGEGRGRGLGALGAAAGEDLGFALGLGGDVFEPAQHHVVEARIGVDALDADAQVLAGVAGEDLAAVGAGGVRRDPVGEGGGCGVGEKRVVGALGERDRADGLQRRGDQRVVGLDEGLVVGHPLDGGELVRSARPRSGRAGAAANCGSALVHQSATKPVSIGLNPVIIR